MGWLIAKYQKKYFLKYNSLCQLVSTRDPSTQLQFFQNNPAQVKLTQNVKHILQQHFQLRK